MRILVIEDDLAIQGVIRSTLADEGYLSDCASRGDDGFTYASECIYDLILLDIMLPGMDGIEVTRMLRRDGVATPILLLTAKDSVEDRVLGLDAGADDYLVKPFAISELLARVRALTRRHGTFQTDDKLVYGRLNIRPDAHDGFVGDVPLKLTVKEYELLEFLIRNRERILTREQIFDRIWGFDADSGTAIVEVYIHYLRKKLAAHSCDDYIHTVRGVGYMMKCES